MWQYLEKHRVGIQIGLAAFMFVVGAVLAFMGFWVVPVGDITHSVLIVVGQFLVAGGTLLGIKIPTYNNTPKTLEKSDSGGEKQ